MSASIQQSAVIIGGGHAGTEAATALRQAGWEGTIVLLSDEPLLPDHRPPLSKACLTGKIEQAALLIKPQAAYGKAVVDVRLQTRVSAQDLPGKTVQLADGTGVAFDKLVLATGGRPRPLVMAGVDPRSLPENLHSLRTVADVDRIRPQLQAGRRLVIIGGGHIGLEVASAARQLGLEVTVLEAVPRVLARVTAPRMSAFHEDVHRQAGVQILTETGLEHFNLNADTGRVESVVCSNDCAVDADLVIVGIGLIPNTQLAEAAGLAVDNGILVDEVTQTLAPDVYAIGDCSNHPNAIYGRRLPLESVPNALDKARAAAAAICGKPKAYAAVPWFWSDQYDLKLQMFGLSQGYDQVVLRGSPATRSFIAFYLHHGEMLAADAVNSPQDFTLAKRLVATQCVVDPERLADENFILKSLLDPVT